MFTYVKRERVRERLILINIEIIYQTCHFLFRLWEKLKIDSFVLYYVDR